MMQGVLALCHFCETDGPRVVMTHQPMKDDFSNGLFEDDFLAAAATSMEPSTSTAPQGPIRHISQYDYLDHDEHLDKEPQYTKFHYGFIDSKNIKHSEDGHRCDSCYSFREGPFLLSNDHDNRISYISSQTALQQTAYERIRIACIKSLSNEIAKLPPEKSSITSIKSTKDPPLIPHPIFPPIRIITRDTTISESSQANSPRSPSAASCISNISDIDINGLLPLSNGSTTEEEKDGRLVFGDAESGYTFSYSFRLYDCRARGYLRMYSLIMNSTDRQVITKNLEFLHSAFEYIKLQLQKMSKETFERDLRLNPSLKKMDYKKVIDKNFEKFFCDSRTAAGRYIDRNLKDITGNEGIWQILHKYMMWTLRSPAMTCRDQVMEGKPTQDMMVLMELEQEAILELELDHPNQRKRTMEQLANLKIIAQQLHVCSEPGDLDLLLRQVTTGGQVVVESRDPLLSKQSVLALCHLLPIGCLKLNTYKDQYRPEDIRRLNLIGGPINMDIPLEVSNVLVLRVTARENHNDENESLQDCQIEVRRRPEKEFSEPTPQIVKRMRGLLLDLDVNGAVLESALRNTRDQWLGRARIFYQKKMYLIKEGYNPTIEDCAVPGAFKEDGPILHFWQEGLANSYKAHVGLSLDPINYSNIMI